MKRIKLLMTIALCFGASIMFAQDTTRTKALKSKDQTKSNQLRNGPDQMPGWTKITVGDLPTALRKTLDGPQYSGWDDSANATYYTNEAGDYSIRTMNVSNTPKHHYFDKQGKVIKKPNE